MTKETMTVHKALAELKTLENRIEKEMKNVLTITTNKSSNTKIDGMTLTEYKKDVKAKWQSANDLVKRMNAIKCAVTQSNATTEVVIAGETYTVAEAIAFKNFIIPIKQKMLNKLTTEYNLAKSRLERENGYSLEERADQFIYATYGKSDMKELSEDMMKSRREWIESNKLELVDALNIKKEIEELDKEINEFVIDVDSQLSVSNAKTEITIEY